MSAVARSGPPGVPRTAASAGVAGCVPVPVAHAVMTTRAVAASSHPLRVCVIIRRSGDGPAPPAGSHVLPSYLSICIMFRRALSRQPGWDESPGIHCGDAARRFRQARIGARRSDAGGSVAVHVPGVYSRAVSEVVRRMHDDHVAFCEPLEHLRREAALLADPDRPEARPAAL